MTTRIGTVRTTDGHLDQESFNTTLRRTDEAVQNRCVAGFTPVLRIDPRWADSDPETARELTAMAEKFVAHVSGQTTPRPLSLDGRVAHVPLADGERHALLILHYAFPRMPPLPSSPSVERVSTDSDAERRAEAAVPTMRTRPASATQAHPAAGTAITPEASAKRASLGQLAVQAKRVGPT
ncbi:hypothetical protein [Streptomyces sp. NPDC058695]|uniref:hypothetical protein n=1 Tax=Streptomyces sp. NPDC058695 TaxID=3346604 RepID=UPI003659F21C